MSSLSEFYNVYNQMMNDKKDNSLSDLVEKCKNIIKDNLKYFIDPIKYRRALALLNLKYRTLDKDYSFNDLKNELKECYLIECEDPITLRFKISLNDEEYIFSIIPKSLIQYIKDKYDFYFLDENNEPYFIFKNGFKITNTFRKLRNKDLKITKAIKENQTFKPHEETMNDVLLQYIGYFRKN